MSRVSGLGTRFALALVPSAARSLLASKSVRRRWFGRVGRVLFPPRQLPLQIRDLLLAFRNLLLGVSDLLLAFRNLLLVFGYFTSEFFVLSQQPLIFPMQLLRAGLVRVPMAIRPCSLFSCAASPSRTHSHYGKRFGRICPEKSTTVPELLQRLDQRPSSRHDVAKTVEPEIASCPLPNPPVLIPRHCPLPRRRSEDSAREQLSFAVFRQTPRFNILAMAPALPFSNRTVSTKRGGRKEQGAVDRNTSYAQDLDRNRAR